VEYLHKTVSNPNIIICGTHSYYSGTTNGCFQETAVRYLYGDAYSTLENTGWQPFWHLDRLFIGDYVQIAADVIFMMGGNNPHNTTFISTYPFLELDSSQRPYCTQGDTVVGHDVWIGTGALIMSGINLGDGAIVGAGAVVINNVHPYTVVAGNPAKIVHQRFSDQEIALLLALQWWYWPEEKIQALKADIQQNKVHRLIAASKQYDLQKKAAGSSSLTKSKLLSPG
jgi:chloramphenicol O-acetyltransferase type B